MRKMAYSYIRFSTPEQAKGDSLRRQLEGSKRWAEEHGYDLDTSLRDLGVSGYHGDNYTGGALGTFLSLIEQGKIDEGSVLILESLDRLSRQEPMKSLNLLYSILSSGIKIVTLMDGQEYTSQNINHLGTLVISLVSMARAHEESSVKSDRVRESLDARIARAREGKGKVSSRCPLWLRYNKDNDSFEIIEERAELVRQIFRKAIAGIGMPRITHELNENNVATWGRASNWTASYLQVLLKNRALIGEYQPGTLKNGKTVPVGDPIKNYYPSVLTEEDFYAAQASIAQRRTKRGRRGKAFSNLLQGMGYCMNCMSKMRYLKTGKYEYLLCSKAFSKGDCDHHKYYPYKKIETLVLMEVANKVDWFSVVSGAQTNLGEMKHKQSALSAKLADTEKRVARYAELFEVAPDDAIELAQERYLGILKEQKAAKAELQKITSEIEMQTMPDAAALKDKMTRAITKLRTETDPQELFEIRATINSSLRDAVRLFFGGHPEDEVAVGYVVSGEKPQVLVYGDESLDMASLVAAQDETRSVISGLEGHINHYHQFIDGITRKTGELMGIAVNNDGTVSISIPSVARQKDMVKSQSSIKDKIR